MRRLRDEKIKGQRRETMFCKFCGNPIDRTTMKCISCGKPVGPLSGGNGFRDAGTGREEPVPRRGGESFADVTAERLDRLSGEIHEVKKLLDTKKRNFTPLVAVIGIVLCLVVLFALNGKNNNKITQLREELTEQIGVTQEKIDSLSGAFTAPEPTEAAGEPQIVLSITKQPTSEDRVELKTATLFICHAEGKNLSFSWLRYDADTKKMVQVKDDEFYTVGSETETDGGQSTLRVFSAGPEQEGVYICMVKDENGQIIYSAPATLRLSGNSSGDDGEPDYDQSESTLTDQPGNDDEPGNDLPDLEDLKDLIGGRP